VLARPAYIKRHVTYCTADICIVEFQTWNLIFLTHAWRNIELFLRVIRVLDLTRCEWQCARRKNNFRALSELNQQHQLIIVARRSDSCAYTSQIKMACKVVLSRHPNTAVPRWYIVTLGSLSVRKRSRVLRKRATLSVREFLRDRPHSLEATEAESYSADVRRLVRASRRADRHRQAQPLAPFERVDANNLLSHAHRDHLQSASRLLPHASIRKVTSKRWKTSFAKRYPKCLCPA
jgi:hypothetical protein